MKMLFVVPLGTGIPALGVMFLSAVLKKNGHSEVEAISLMKEPVTYERSEGYLLEKLKEKPIVGVSSTSPDWIEATRIAELAKQNGCTVIVGGPGPSILKEKILEKYPLIDFVVYGEGENAIVPLIKSIENNILPKDVKGVIYRDNGKIIVNPPNVPIEDLDSLPFADRDCWNLETFHGALSILTSRGCPYNCNFCFKPVHGLKFRARSPKNVADEIGWLLKNYPSISKKVDRKIVFADDNFSMDINRAKAIADEIIKRKIKCKLVFVNGLHVNHVDEELMKKLKKAGAVEVWFGCDAGSEEVLKKLGKGITLDKVRTAVELAKKAGVERVGVHFILGLEGETFDTAMKTIKFAESLNLNTIGFNHANVLPGTKLWEYANKHGKLLFEHDGFNFTNFKQLNTEPIFETPEFTREERIKAYNEAVKLMDKVRRKNTLKPKNILKFISTVRNPSDILWVVDRAKTFLFTKDLRHQKRKPKPSDLNNFDKISVKNTEDI